MSVQLKTYKPSKKGAELIAILFPLSSLEKEQNLNNYWKQYPHEINAILDGFHFIVQEIIEERGSDQESHQIDIDRDLIYSIIKEMRAKKNYFSYGSAKEFFAELTPVEPSLFKNQTIIQATLRTLISDRFTPNPAFKFPEDWNEEIENRCKEHCKACETAYDEVLPILPSLQKSQRIFEQFRNNSESISMIDAALAKETFIESKEIYLKHANVIAKNMPFIYEARKYYLKQPFLIQIYLKYLAKFLSSRETRVPVEKFVLQEADGAFSFDMPKIEEEKTGKKSGAEENKKLLEYLAPIKLNLVRLECRYRKRILMQKYKSGASFSGMVKELMQIIDLDYQDVRTHIFLARLFSDQLKKNQEVKIRTNLRAQAIAYCSSASQQIDDFLDLQHIRKQIDRDRMRTSFMKTISSIRIPLVKNG